MSIVTMKTVNKTFVDFVDFVDAEDPGGESEEEEEDNVGVCTWPVFDLRSSSKESASTRATSKASVSTTEEETGAARTPDNEDFNSDAAEVEMQAMEPDAACEAAKPPSSSTLGEEGLGQDEEEPATPWPISRWNTAATSIYEADDSPSAPAYAEESPSHGDDDLLSPCPVSRWNTAATSIYEADKSPSAPADAEESPVHGDDDLLSPCPVSRWHIAATSRYCPPPGQWSESSPALATKRAPTAEPAFLPDGLCRLSVPGEASPLAPAGFSAPEGSCITRLQQLRRNTALLPVTSVPLPLFGQASPHASAPQPTAARAGALAAAQVALYAAGSTLAKAASAPPLPPPPSAPPRAFGGAAKAGASPAARAPACAAGSTLSIEASLPPLPPAGWPALPRAVALAPQMAAARCSTQPAQATQVRSAQRRQAGFQREDPNRLERRRHPARPRAEGEQVGPREPLEERTTVMLRNIPNNYTRDMLRELIESRGFGRKCDFLYLPIDFHTQSNLGYAFVNLERAEDARMFWAVFEGFNKWAMRSQKVGSLRWSECQGLEANINRYRNSPVMGEEVPDRYKPAVYEDGKQAEFPRPTQPLKAPRIKQAAFK